MSGGRAEWQAVLDAFWRDFKPKTAEVMEQPSRRKSPRRSTSSCRPICSRRAADGADPRLCPNCGNGRLALARRQVRRVRRLLQLSRMQVHPPVRRRRGRSGARPARMRSLGNDPETGLPVERKSGRFGPYVQLGEGKEAKRASIPKDVGPNSTSNWRSSCCRLPREVGTHPESGKPITATIGRYGPYLLHDGKYARLQSTAEVFETGMNAAVVKLAEAAASGGRPARGSARAAEGARQASAHRGRRSS